MSWFNVIFLIYQVIAIVTVIHVIMDNRQPAKTMAWALVIWFIPVVGIVFYLFFGINTRKERHVSERSMNQLTKRSMLEFAEQQNLRLPDKHKPLIDLFINQNLSLPFKDNKVEIYTDGYQFFPALLSAIHEARNHVHIDMYIFAEDALGYLVADALIAKAREGVEVRVIYDDVGCWNVSHRFFERMREEGIEVVSFLPVRFPSFTSKVNYRNHRKIVVIDGSVGFIGGMNIALLIGALSSIAQAAGILVGKRLGEEEYDKAYSESKLLMRYGFVGSVALSLLLIMLKGCYVRIYNVEEYVLQTAEWLLVAFAILAPFKVQNMILGGGIIRSGGKTKYIMWIDLMGTWLLGVPIGFISAYIFCIPAAWV